MNHPQGITVSSGNWLNNADITIATNGNICSGDKPYLSAKPHTSQCTDSISQTGAGVTLIDGTWDHNGGLTITSGLVSTAAGVFIGGVTTWNQSSSRFVSINAYSGTVVVGGATM